MGFNRLHIVIPSRYDSTRLPAKPLRLIAGKPMIERVYQQANKSKIDSICVATDDTRIYKTVEAFNGNAVMTHKDHRSGTERLAEVCEKMQWDDNDIVINLQGDEPLIPPEVINQLANEAILSLAEITTLGTPIQRIKDIFNPNIVKIVLDAKQHALYFSRAPIAWDRDNFSWQEQEGLSQSPCYRHLGMYAYRVKALKQIPLLPPSPLEALESLEQLRPLYHGMKIQVAIVDEAPQHGVDTEEDLMRVNAHFAKMKH
ncbi:MAG: 3-deoxy-manno-octulosonate cytidylyltransferase [Thiotrichaceae bacterium]|nr:3-deoxy-manno-octulosonate cytidylyltransferase [Thiotrichaceae bacterium]